MELRGAVADSVQLNPMRAGVMDVDEKARVSRAYQYKRLPAIYDKLQNGAEAAKSAQPRGFAQPCK
jgi:hypothetical protein